MAEKKRASQMQKQLKNEIMSLVSRNNNIQKELENKVDNLMKAREDLSQNNNTLEKEVKEVQQRFHSCMSELERAR